MVQAAMPSFSTEKFAVISSFAMARFVLWGTYCADALEKRAPYRDEHLARLQSLKEQGTLVTLGPIVNDPDGDFSIEGELKGGMPKGDFRTKLAELLPS